MNEPRHNLQLVGQGVFGGSNGIGSQVGTRIGGGLDFGRVANGQYLLLADVRYQIARITAG